MLFRQLKYFIAVVDKGNFHEAAEQCFVSQSAISQQIIKLEEELGVKLLDRQGRSIAVTNAGNYFYHKAVLVLRDIENLKDQCRLFAEKKEKIKLGCIDCYHGAELANAICELKKENANIAVETCVRTHEELFKDLENDHLDLVLSDQRRAFSQAYLNVILTKAQIFIEISAKDPLAKLQFVDINEIKNLCCIIVGNTKYVKEVESKYVRENFGEKFDFKFAYSAQEAELMVQSGFGFTLADSTKNNARTDNSICRIPLMRNEAPLYTTYCVFAKKNKLNNNIELLIKLLKKQYSI